MSLDTWEVADRLYVARGDEVSSCRPLFTGDVFDDVAIPGVQRGGSAQVIAHPCSMRSGSALSERVLVASVRTHERVPARKWADGFNDRMPLPDVRGSQSGFEVALLAEIGLADTAALLATARLACLSELGVNILQQRMVFHLTRLEVPTPNFWEAFAHTYEEADLLEEWTEDLSGSFSHDSAVANFEEWIRKDARLVRLRDPQQRASVRSEMRKEIRSCR